MTKKEEYTVTLTQKELEELDDALCQLESIFSEINGEGNSDLRVASITRHIDIAELRGRLIFQTHDDNGDWL